MSVIKRATEMLKYEGVKSTAWRGAKWLTSRSNPFEEVPLTTVFKQDVLAVDWTQNRQFKAEKPVQPNGKPQIAWVISPPGRSSGGHQNAYLFMEFLEQAGYEITIFLYSAGQYPKVSVEGVKHMLSTNSGYPKLNAEYRMYDPETGITGDFDVVVATDWATAYAAWRYERNVPRIYWVLDFEPYFFPAGPDYVVAENSYRLGYHGITIGPWLAAKLKRDYGMPSDFYEYAVDASRYTRTNDAKRNEILFYARPTTPRRGTEFGLLVLEEVHRRRPDITINIAGWDMSKAGIEFPFVNHGTLQVSQLPELYNRCGAALVLSLTCMSLLPLEVMACGVVPVVNDGENTRMTLRDDPRIEFVPMSPALMADRIIAALDRPDQVEYSRFLAMSAEGGSWKDAGAHVVATFDKIIKRKKKIMPLVDPESQEAVDATVFIPTFNGEKYLEKLLLAVESQDFVGNFEILIIDSGSTDNTLEIIKGHPLVNLVLIPNSEFGHGKTRNLAAKIARGKYVAFLSHDAIPLTNQWLTSLLGPLIIPGTKCVASFGKHVARADCFPNLKYEIQNLFNQCGADGLVTYVGKGINKNKLFSSTELFYSDVNSASSKKFLTEILPYRDVNYSEDLYFAEDLLNLNYIKAYVPFAAVEHSNDVSVEEYKKRIFDETVGRNKASYDSDHFKLKFHTSLRGVKDCTTTIIRIINDSEYTFSQKISWILKTPKIIFNKWHGIYLGTNFLNNPYLNKSELSLEFERRQAH